MTHTDRFGLALSTASGDAAQAYRDGLDLFLAYQAGAIEKIDQAIALDPEFALAHIARARILQVYAQVPQARQAATQALALSLSATQREQQHVAIVAHLINAKPAQAFALLRTHAEQYPRDALPISVALGAIGLFAFSGEPDSREAELAFLESLAPHWQGDWWFDTYLGWAYVETGAHQRGIALLDKALITRPENAQAVHARAHGFYECGDTTGGRQFINNWIAENDDTSLLFAHLRWHQALFAIQAGETEQAHQIYAESIAPEVSKAMPLLVLMDAASFAWRSLIYGSPLTPEQLAQVADQARECLPKAGPAFFNWHKAMALAGVQDQAGLQTLSESLTDLVAQGKQLPGSVMVALCDGMAAYAAGQYEAAVDALQPAVSQANRIGGSSAQQDVVADTAIAALLAAGRPEQAKQLAQERGAHRAAHLNQQWLAQLTASGNA